MSLLSVFRRSLFWRVYLIVMVSLWATAILSGVIWHVVVDAPKPMTVNTSGEALGALLPGENAARAETESALRRISAASGGRVALLARDGALSAAADKGRVVSPEIRGTQARDAQGRFTPLGPWRTLLRDGRVLWIDVPPPPQSRPAQHILLVLLLLAVLIGMIAYPVVSLVTRRLERLRSSLDAWGEGRLDSRAKVEGRDEIAAVAMSFNAAADRVEKLLAAHRTLLAHASHELRSPLTRLRLAVEMFLAAPDPGLRPAIERDIAELDSLVEEILLASRLDHAPDATEVEVVDLLALAAEEAARTDAQLRHDAVQAGALEVKGSSRLLRRLIRNLLENAAKHGEPPVGIALARLGAGAAASVSITVFDQGTGLPDGERERVFEPFYRPAGRGEAAGSWGLGLSIVRQIAERHGGTVAYAPPPGGEGGGGFVVLLPAPQSKAP